MPKKIQAKHVDEAAILAWLNREPGKWHTHFTPNDWSLLKGVDDPWFLRNCFPDRGADIPEKVLLAKLSSMKRRGLIDGCDCGCRGDWHVLAPGIAAFKAVLELLGPDAVVTNTVTTYEGDSIKAEVVTMVFDRRFPFPPGDDDDGV